MSDVKLYQTLDGGEINAAAGVIEIGGGLETAVYLSLFGGNIEDDGSQNSTAQWWGNVDEADPARRYRSETQNLLEALPATSANLLRVEDAARRDLAWMIDADAADSVEVAASIPARNWVLLTVTIDGSERLAFRENWRSEYGA